MNLAAMIALNFALAALSYSKRLLSRSGAVSGFVIGLGVSLALGWQGWMILMFFFFGGTAATFLGQGKKEKKGVAQEDHGRRRWNHAWANAGCGVFCALLSWIFIQSCNWEEAEAWRWAFVACFAAALSDTLSSEFGQVANQQPWLITTGEVVPVGTDGGITRAGILMGILGAAVLTLLARFLGLVPVRATLPVLLAGISGNLLDSLLGATLQKRGVLNNDTVNLGNTLAGAALGYFGFWVMRALPLWLQQMGVDHFFFLDLFI